MASSPHQEPTLEQPRQQQQSASALAPLSDEQIALLTLRFDENEFGYLPPESAPTISPSGQQQQSVASAFIPFSEYDFVKEKQEHMSLDDLRTDLGTYSRLLENKIMQHIHEDVHEAFVTVSGQLVGMTDPLSRALQPLQAARKRLHGSLQHLESANTTIVEAMSEARRAEISRQFQVTILQIFLTHESACRIYNDLNEAQEGMNLVVPPGLIGATSSKGAYTVRPVAVVSSSHIPPSSHQQDEATHRAKQWETFGDIEKHDNLIEALAQHVTRLRTLWTSLPPTAAFCLPISNVPANEAEGCMQRIEEANISRREAFDYIEETNKALHLALGTATYDAYLASLSTTDAAVGIRRFSQLLQQYKYLGDEKELALMYRDVIVRPIVEGVVSWKVVSEARKSTTVFTQIFADIKTVLSNKVLHIVPLLRDTFGSSMSPISDIIWAAVCDTLVKRMMFLFSPALPDVFHINFTAAHDLLALLEDHCETPQELFALRNSSDMSMWVRKWNLDVYHVQRTQELTDAIDKLFAQTDLLSQPSSEPTAVPPTNVSMLTKVAQTIKLPTSLYSYHYARFFEGLSDIGLRVFGQKVFLYPIAARQVKLSLTLLHNGLQRVVSEVQKMPHEGSPYVNLCYLQHDLATFETFIKNDFIPIARVALGGEDGRNSQSSGNSSTPQSPTSHSTGLAIGNLFKLAATCVGEKLKQVTNALHSALMEAAGVPLERSLSAVSTRMGLANTPMPSEPSSQLEDTVSVFKQFEALPSNVIDSAVAQQILQGVGHALCEKHKGAVCTALKFAWRRLNALQKMKRAANTGGTTTALDTTDLDKMVYQLYLDMSFIERQLHKYISVPMRTSDNPNCSNETVFEFYFAPLMKRGEWINTYRRNAAAGDHSDAPPAPPLWDEVSEN